MNDVIMNSIHITQNAWKKITQILKATKNHYGFLYSASSGGCNGFNFEFDLLQKKTHDEIIQQKYHTLLTHKDAKVYVDPLSEMHLLGTTIDYVTENYEKGDFESKFQFEINKELMNTCGCGISFSHK